MMNEKDARQCGQQLLASANSVVVSTVDDSGYPYARVMFNLHQISKFPHQAAYVKENYPPFHCFLTTNTSSFKVEQLRKNSKASLCFSVPRFFQSLMLSGDLMLVTEKAILQTLWKKGWERYYPLGLQDPDYAIVHFSPRLARGWNQGQAFEFALLETKG